MELKKYKIQDLGTVITGKTPSTKQGTNFDGNIPFVTPEDIANNFYNLKEPIRYISEQGFESIKANTINGKSILVGCIGSDMGNVGFINARCATNQQINAITKINSNFIPEYIYYNLCNQKEYFRRNAGSTTTPILPKSVFELLDFYCCNLENQKRIANVLSIFDKKIEINKEIIKQLEVMTKELYYYWFVQFDFPCTDGKPYKSSGGKMSFNPIIKRDIPDEWEVKKISSQIKENIGGDWGNEKPEGNYQLKVSCCRGADIVSMTDLPTRYILNANSSKLLKEDDIIVEISGGSPTQATGRCVLISKEILNSFDNKLICSNFCQAISILDKDYVSYFYHMWKMFYDSDVYFNFEGKTSGIKNFQYDTFVAEKWYFPPKDLAIKFGEIVSKNYKKKCELELENKRLAALRDELLPMLMNGQVTIK